MTSFFCDFAIDIAIWSGKVAVIQASSDDIQAAVLLHPSNVTVEDMKGENKPFLYMNEWKFYYEPSSCPYIWIMRACIIQTHLHSFDSYVVYVVSNYGDKNDKSDMS